MRWPALRLSDGEDHEGEHASTRRSAWTTDLWVALVMRTDQVFLRCLADGDLMAGVYEMLAADYD
jgi:hypothetical protein